ncbi:MAG: hypothetical protein G01um101466_463 [Parcubacteria group bacterium Gr01-1014_66]|nr:MAG: hypothetical protein G01um101466_463 [Parcubacteria group bacterium Gr01-1014_66]
MQNNKSAARQYVCKRRSDKMKITVRVKPNAKKDHIEAEREGEYIAQIKAAPAEGKANNALIKLLAAHFDIARSRIKIISGFSSRNKIIEIIYTRKQ